MGACDGWSWEQSKGDLLISGLHTYMNGGDYTVEMNTLRMTFGDLRWGDPVWRCQPR